MLPISRENLRKTDPCLGSFASQRDPSEWHIGTIVDTGSAPPPRPGPSPPPPLSKWNVALHVVYQYGISHIKMEFCHEFNAIT